MEIFTDSREKQGSMGEVVGAGERESAQVRYYTYKSIRKNGNYT